MTDTRDPQTEKGQNDATEENLAETAQAPEKTLEEQFREEICPTCTVKAEADETRLRALAEMENSRNASSVTMTNTCARQRAGAQGSPARAGQP